MFNIKYNSRLLPSGVWLATVPKINNSDVKRNRYTIPMHDGDMLSNDFYHGSAYITLTVHTNDWNGKKHALKHYFATTTAPEGYVAGQLQIFEGEAPTWGNGTFFKVKAVRQTSEEQKKGNYGRATFEFEVEPIEYIQDAGIIFTGGSSSVVTNDYSAIAKPKFYISQGSSGTIQLTGKSAVTIASFDSAQLVLDTRSKTIVNASGVLCENLMTGDYEDLWIDIGGTTITFGANMAGFFDANRGDII